ncbi:hypothetical protein NMG60_11031405 [Bertholletia excelsa]
MADAAVDSPSDRLQLDSIPVIDLRFLSQSELYALSLCSDAAFDPRRCEDVVIPKIDRSVFNESAGSRKQTFSRLRLAPRKPESSAAPSSNFNNPSNLRSFNSDPERAENSQIVGLLKQLFVPTHNGDDLVPIRVEYSDSVPQLPNEGNIVKKRKRGRPRKNENLAVVPVEVQPENVIKDIVVYEHVEEKEKEIVNMNGSVVDLAALASLDDPYGFEVRRRTEGLKTEDELLGRKKKRIVDASEFGDILPKGWKIMLSLKRKEGHVWIFVRRYISPNGQQFVTCKEVSSYLLSFWLQDVNQPNCSQSIENIQLTCKNGGGNSADPALREINHRVDHVCSSPSVIMCASNDHEKQVISDMGNSTEIQMGDVLKCDKCTMTFDAKDDLLQHELSSHRRKRSRFGTSITDGVIIKGGQYECQFCHKTFNERNRYNGHVGAHKRHHLKSDEALPGMLNKEHMTGSLSSSEVKDSTMQSSMEDSDAKNVSPPSAVVSPKVPSVQNSIGPVSSTVFPPKKSTDLTPTGDDCDAVMYNAKVDNNLQPVSLVSNIESHTQRSGNEVGLSSHDMDSQSCRNESNFVEEVLPKHDENKETKFCLEMMDKAAQVVNTKSDFYLDSGALSGNGTNNDGEANVLNCSVNGPNNTPIEPGRRIATSPPSMLPDEKMNFAETDINRDSRYERGPHQEVGGKSVLLTPSGAEKTEKHSASLMERFKLGVQDSKLAHGFCKAAAPILSDVTEVKQQNNSEGCGLVPFNNDQKSGNSSNTEAGVTSLYAESEQQKNVSESIDVENQVVKSNADRPCFSSISRPEFNAIYNKPLKEVIIACGSDVFERDGVAVTGDGQKKSENSLLDSSLKEQLNAIADNGNASTACRKEELRQEKSSERNLLISSGYKQNSDVKTDVVNVTTRKMDEPVLNEVQTYRSNEVTPGISVSLLNMHEREFGLSSRVLSENEPTFNENKNGARIHSSMEETTKLENSLDGGLLFSCMGKNLGDSCSKDKVATNSFEEPKPDELKNSGNSDLILAFGNSEARIDADVINSVPIERTFSFATNLIGENSSVGKDQKQKSGLLGENNLNMVLTGRFWEGPMTNEVQRSALPDSGFMTHNMWRIGGEHVLQSTLASTSTQQDQSSSCFPTLNTVSDKGELELLGISEKNNAVSGFEGTQGQGEHVELSFLTTQNLIPLPQESKSLSYDTGIDQGFDSPFWLGKDALSLNIATRNLVTSVY